MVDILNKQHTTMKPSSPAIITQGEKNTKRGDFNGLLLRLRLRILERDTLLFNTAFERFDSANTITFLTC